MNNLKKKVLIAEDERPIAKALELKLNKEGIQAETVFDGESALKMIKENKYDILMLDLVMPRKNGFAVLEEIKKENIDIPVIVMSNLSQKEDMEKAEHLGAKRYFIKSDTPIAEVVALVKEILK